MSNCKKHKINDVNDYKHLTPDTDCTCEGAHGSDRGAGMGPATDPELMAKRKEPILNPAPAEATGPAKEIQ